MSQTIPAGKTLLADVSIERFSDIESALDSAWQTLNPKGDIAWTPARTPFYANQAWQSPRTVWTSYAFAYGHAVTGNIADGQHVARPWALITFNTATNTLAVTTMAGGLIDCGEIQGVQPLDDDSANVLKRMAEFQKWVLTHPKWPTWNAELSEMQQFYLTWGKYNGVIVKLIEPAHTEFVNKWVHVTVN